MKKIETRVKKNRYLYNNWENGLFFDIETTGFHRKYAKLYLIGVGYITEDELIIIQWFNDDGNEAEILKDFLNFTEQYTLFVNYNGIGFDIPFLESKVKEYGYSTSFFTKKQIDLYREIRPYQKFLNLADLKLPTVERFFMMERTEEENGKTLIPIYKSYLESPTEEKKQKLLEHNYFDIINLIGISQIMGMKNCLSGDFCILESQKTDQYLNIQLKFKYSFSKLVQGEKNGILYSFYGTKGELNIPVYMGEMKFYYKNFKDYYYLPYENMVIHKSVASFVDAKNKEKCTAKNCFIIKKGIFLEQYEMIFEQVFCKDIGEKEIYFLAEDYFKSEYMDKQMEYIKSVLKYLS